jgi:misacylated tRNA(Ala) deacylase
MDPVETTELLFWESIERAYVRTFTATVRSLPPGEVILDRTLFYPVGGGQPSDHGYLRDGEGREARVVHVEKRGGLVVHRLDRRSPVRFSQGAVVTGEIDWERRYRHMRAHTAQHLVSALVFRHHGLRTEKARIQSDGAILTVSGSLPGDAWQDLARRANNEYLTRDVPVSVEFLRRQELESLGGRADPDRVPSQIGRVRMIVIESLDRCPCGGTHVRNTQEVGPVELQRLEPSPGGQDTVILRISPGPGPGSEKVGTTLCG